MTDGIPDEDFIALFHRLAQYVRLGRTRSPEEIKGRIKRILDLQRQAYRTAKRGTTINKFRGNYVRLRRLYRANIHETIWDKAVTNPNGLIDNTLDFGYAKAKRMQLRRARDRSGQLKTVRRQQRRG